MITYRYQTNSRTILADLYTPVGVYMRLRDIYPQSALMESSDYHDKNNSRSFIGINPIASVAIGHGEATVNFPDGSIEKHAVNKEYRSDKAILRIIPLRYLSEKRNHRGTILRPPEVPCRE